MKIIKLLISIVLLVSVLSYDITNANAAKNYQNLYVIADQLNVREKASIKSKKVGLLKRGFKVKVYARTKDGWSKIDYKNKKAYVSSKYIKNAPKNQFSRIKFFATLGLLESALPVIIGENALTAINYLGTPTSTYTLHGDLVLDYSKKNKGVYVFVNEERNSEDTLTFEKITQKSYISMIEKYLPSKPVTYKQIKTILGKADSSYKILDSNDFMIGYDLGNYQLIFHTHNLKSLNEKLTDNKKIISYSVNRTYFLDYKIEVALKTP